MDERDLSKLISAVRETVKEEMALYNKHVCRFSITDEEFNIHLAEMKEIGGGDLMTAMHEIRDNHLWFKNLRSRAHKAGEWMAYAVIVALVGTAVAVFVEGGKIILKFKGVSQ